MSVVTRIRTSQELTVPFSPEEVWRVLEDVAAYPEWWPAKLRVAVLHYSGELLGAEFEVRPILGALFRVRFEEIEGRSSMRLRFFGGSLEGPGGFHLMTLDGATTRVRYEMDVFTRGLDVAALSLVVPFERIHRSRMSSVLNSLAKRLNTLRKAAEREAGQSRRLIERQRALRQAEEEAVVRRAAEERARKRAADQEAVRRAAAEEARRLAEEEAAARAAVEEELRRAAELEAARRADEDAAKKRAEEEALARAAAAEEQRRAAEEEARARAAAEEAARRAVEEENARQAAQEVKRRAEEEAAARASAEEEQRRAAEEEATRRAAEEAAKKRAEEEALARAAAAEEQRRAAEEEARARAAAEEAARLAVEEEAVRRAAEEAKRRAEEDATARAAAEEEQRRAAELEAARRAAEDAARKRAEEKALARAATEEAERRAAEEEARRLTAAEEKRRAEEEASVLAAAAGELRRAAEVEAARRAAEEAEKKRAAEEALARAAAEESERRAAEKEARGRAAREAAGRATVNIASSYVSGEVDHASPERRDTGSTLRSLWRRLEGWLTEPSARVSTAVSSAETEQGETPERESNFEIARRYLESMSSGARPQDIAEYFAPDATDEEFPHRFLETPVTRGLDGIRKARALSLERFSSQRYELAGATGGGSQVAMEVWWRGTVATSGDGFAPGQELDARIAMFLKFADGRIMRQRAYPCFEPWSTRAERRLILDERLTQAGQATTATPHPSSDQPRRRPTGSNFEIARAYLDALGARADADAIACFYSEDAVQDEFPNRLLRGGAHRDLPAIKLARTRGLALMASENYELAGATGGGSQVALEVAWSGVVGEGLGLFTRGQRLEARLGVFLKFRDGLIVAQRNYDCPLADVR